MWKENLPINCPPSTALETNCEVFRILKDSIPIEADFKPYAVLYKDNPRYNTLCKAYAVSFYNSIKNARIARMDSIKRGNNIGNYIGQFNIVESDGRNEFNRKSGHINTWFYDSWDFNNFVPSFVREINEN